MSGPAWIVRKRIAIPPDQKKPQKFTSAASVNRPYEVDSSPTEVHPSDKGDHREEHCDDRPAQECCERVPEDDPAPTRRGEHEPLREPSLEVARDAEPREDTAERR